MNKQQRDLLLEEMDLLLETLNEQYAQARSTNGIIPLIEVDIMKMTLQRMYQQMNYLATDATSREHAEPVTQVAAPAPVVERAKAPVVSLPVEQIITLSRAVPTPAPVPEPAVQELRSEEKAPAAVAPVIPPVAPPVEQPVQIAEPVLADIRREVLMDSAPVEVQAPVAMSSPQPETAPLTTPVATRTEAQKVVAQTGMLFDEPAPATIGNRYKEQDTVHKKIAVTADDQRLAGKLQQVPLDDIRKSIGINDRFAFINELFGGNHQQYSENIEKLNNLSDYTNARRLLYDELAVNLNWNKESKAFHQLDSLVKRRFSAG